MEDACPLSKEKDVLLRYADIVSVIAELKMHEASVVDAIEEVLLEPVPKSDDAAEVEEFRRKMVACERAAEGARLRSDLLAKVEARLAELAQASQIG